MMYEFSKTSLSAYDHADNVVIGSSYSYIFDSTPPTCGNVYIGHYLNHLLYVKSKVLVLHLTGCFDIESGIEKIEYGVGSTNNSANVIPMIEHNHMQTPIEITENGALFDGHTYYVLVQVCKLNNSNSFLFCMNI